jgi:hypothetical protein
MDYYLLQKTDPLGKKSYYNWHNKAFEKNVTLECLTDNFRKLDTEFYIQKQDANKKIKFSVWKYRLSRQIVSDDPKELRGYENELSKKRQSSKG